MTTTTTPAECAICIRKFTKSVRTPVPCQSSDCTFASCAACVKEFLLTQTTSKCMDCGATWSRKHVVEHLGASWVNNNLFKAQAGQLLAQQLSLLQHDTEEAELVKLIDASKKTHRTLLKQRKLCIEARETLADTGDITAEQAEALDIPLYTIEHAADYKTQVQDMIVRRHYAVQRDILATNGILFKLEDARRAKTGSGSGAGGVKVHCPVADCRGFAGEPNWSCSSCKANICMDCHEVVAGESHVCDPKALETIQLLRNDTKPCPKCQTPIHKISGCDQMWCICCKTAFSWDTGRIEKGLIHNPHFYQFQAGHIQQIRNVGDVACGGIPNFTDFTRNFADAMALVSNMMISEMGMFKTDKSEIACYTRRIYQLSKLCQLVVGFTRKAETLQDELNNLREAANQRETQLRNMRIDFILHKIKNEKAYETKLAKHLTQNELDNEKMLVLEMVTTCLIERVRNLMEDPAIADVPRDYAMFNFFMRQYLVGLRHGDLPLPHGLKHDLFNYYEYAKNFIVPEYLVNAATDINPLLCQLHMDVNKAKDWGFNIETLFENRQQKFNVIDAFLTRAKDTVKEMVEIVNYANEQFDVFYELYGVLSPAFCVPEFDLSIPDELVEHTVEKGYLIVENNNTRKQSMDARPSYMMRSPLVRFQFGVDI